jgi:hypothetical protein
VGAIGIGVLILMTAVPPASAAEPCLVTRDQILRDVEAGMSDVALHSKYQGCQDSEQPPELWGVEPGAAAQQVCGRQVITDTGSTAFEALTGCGYHPQRRELVCPVEIRQRFGFGGPPAIQPAGSFVYVQFCVDVGAGLVPVNASVVHMHDEVFGVQPDWYMAVVIAADADREPALTVQPLNGTTLRARAILSWAINPLGDCTFDPVFGNQADFCIRLDP